MRGVALSGAEWRSAEWRAGVGCGLASGTRASRSSPTRRSSAPTPLPTRAASTSTVRAARIHATNTGHDRTAAAWRHASCVAARRRVLIIACQPCSGAAVRADPGACSLAAGVLKHSATYEIMTPESVGIDGQDGRGSLVLGKHSGKAAYRQRLIELGYEDVASDAASTRARPHARTRHIGDGTCSAAGQHAHVGGTRSAARAGSRARVRSAREDRRGCKGGGRQEEDDLGSGPRGPHRR